MKSCSCCGKSKDESEFQVRKASKDGLTSSCKECLRERDTRRYREKERDLRIDRQKAYMKTPAGKEAHKKATAKWRHENRLRRAAHVLLNNAVRDGRVKPTPCWICGEKAEAHHPDYDRPLDVVWLCKPHHTEIHTERHG